MTPVDVEALSNERLHLLRNAVYKEIKRRHKKAKDLQRIENRRAVKVNDPKRRWQLYVLLLQGNNYYVGITSQKIESRYEQHQSGTGAKWTRLHKPIGVVETVPLGMVTQSEAARYEDIKTAEMMMRYGENSVRGGSACNLHPTAGYKHKVAKLERHLLRIHKLNKTGVSNA